MFLLLVNPKLRYRCRLLPCIQTFGGLGPPGGAPGPWIFVLLAAEAGLVTRQLGAQSHGPSALQHPELCDLGVEDQAVSARWEPLFYFQHDS